MQFCILVIAPDKALLSTEKYGYCSYFSTKKHTVKHLGGQVVNTPNLDHKVPGFKLTGGGI